MQYYRLYFECQDMHSQELKFQQSKDNYSHLLIIINENLKIKFLKFFTKH
jgi:hypothetical protein